MTTEKKPGLFKKIAQRMPFKAKPSDIEFFPNGELTLGVEIELQLIDPQSHTLVSRAEELLKAGSAMDKLKPEFYLSTVEINTGICQDVKDVQKDLTESYDQIGEIGKATNIDFATTGCHPFARYSDCVITPSPRYNELIDRNQWLTRRMTVYGLHVHVGMKSAEDCIRFNNFYLHFLPHLLALSASSPFWQGDDTGLASCRPTTYEALPTAGQPYQVKNWHEFEYLYQTLKNADAIQSMKDLWWDMRPAPNFGTLEIRVCDGPATLSEALAITAYIHLLAHWFRDHGDWMGQVPFPPRWIARENKWRVMRYGLDALLVANDEGKTTLIRNDIEDWLIKVEPYIEKLGYHEYVRTIREILVRGNSSTRQRNVYNATQKLTDVVKFNVDEFNRRAPNWDVVPNVAEQVRSQSKENDIKFSPVTFKTA